MQLAVLSGSFCQNSSCSLPAACKTCGALLKRVLLVTGMLTDHASATLVIAMQPVFMEPTATPEENFSVSI